MVEVREAAELVHRTPETVRRWVWSGRLAARKEGNRLLLSRDDLARLAGTEAGQQEEAPPSLAEWQTETDRLLGPGLPGVSAADLVRADRADRADRGELGRADAGR